MNVAEHPESTWARVFNRIIIINGNHHPTIIISEAGTVMQLEVSTQQVLRVWEWLE